MGCAKHTPGAARGSRIAAILTHKIVEIGHRRARACGADLHFPRPAAAQRCTHALGPAPGAFAAVASTRAGCAPPRAQADLHRWRRLRIAIAAVTLTQRSHSQSVSHVDGARSDRGTVDALRSFRIARDRGIVNRWPIRSPVPWGWGPAPRGQGRSSSRGFRADVAHHDGRQRQRNPSRLSPGTGSSCAARLTDAVTVRNHTAMADGGSPTRRYR